MLRADAFATLYCLRPLQQLFPERAGLPILMYHSISDREERTHPYYRTVTSPEVFAQQMKYLHTNGYIAVSLEEAVRRLKGPGTGSSRLVAITFDDGFQDFYTSAFPILAHYGFNATMYLPTAFIGESSQSFTGVPCLTWAQVHELLRAGVQFGSHTVTHPQLRSLNDGEVRYELRLSKETIERELGCSVTSFAYPYAFPETDHDFTNRLLMHLEEAGYESGVSTIIGTAQLGSTKFFMPRLPINSCDSLQLLQAKLDGAYNWLHAFQYVAKLLTRMR